MEVPLDAADDADYTVDELRTHMLGASSAAEAAESFVDVADSALDEGTASSVDVPTAPVFSYKTRSGRTSRPSLQYSRSGQVGR
jgi:major membrane immunogen (membrane-anchored lipoprotein)